MLCAHIGMLEMESMYQDPRSGWLNNGPESPLLGATNRPPNPLYLLDLTSFVWDMARTQQQDHPRGVSTTLHCYRLGLRLHPSMYLGNWP